MKVTDKMVNKFLTWKLPQDFSPDCHIEFTGNSLDFNGNKKQWPVGTNLLTYSQAKEMLEHVLED